MKHRPNLLNKSMKKIIIKRKVYKNKGPLFDGNFYGTLIFCIFVIGFYLRFIMIHNY